MIHFQEGLTPELFILTSSIAEGLSRQERSKTPFFHQLTTIGQKLDPGHIQLRLLGFNSLHASFPTGERFYNGRDKPRRPAMPHPFLSPSLESCLYGNGTERIKFPVPSLEKKHKDSVEGESQTLRTELCSSLRRD